MNSTPQQHLVNIGNGIAGVTVARHVRKMSDMRITIISSESKHFFSRPALMYMFMGHMTIENTKPYEYGFALKLGTELKEILPDEQGRVGAVVTNKGERIECQLVGLTPGVHPNIDVVRGTKIDTGRGVLVNDFLETNIPDVLLGSCPA